MSEVWELAYLSCGGIGFGDGGISGNMEKDGCMTKIKYRPFVGKKYSAGIQGKKDF
jgi:hypothetical protein